MTPELSPDDRLYVLALARAYVLAPEGNGAGSEEQTIDNALFLAAERLVIGKNYMDWTDADEDQFAAWRNDLIEDAECALAVEAPIAEPERVPA